MNQTAVLVAALLVTLLAWTMAVIVGAPLPVVVAGETVLGGLVVAGGLGLTRNGEGSEG